MIHSGIGDERDGKVVGGPGIKEAREGWLTLKDGYACLDWPFFYLQDRSVCLNLDLTESWSLNGMLLICLYLNRSWDRKCICYLHVPKCISLHCTCRQKQHPIPLSPWPRQQPQRYLAWWLSKCSLWGVRSYFQTISQDDNSPTPCTAPLSTICGPRWANSSAHSWRQKHQGHGQNKDVTQSEFNAVTSERLTDKSSEGNAHLSVPLLRDQRLKWCISTCSKQVGGKGAVGGGVVESFWTLMCGDGVKKGIPHVGRAFHFGFAQSQHTMIHMSQISQSTASKSHTGYCMHPVGAIGFYGEGERTSKPRCGVLQ